MNDVQNKELDEEHVEKESGEEALINNRFRIVKPFLITQRRAVYKVQDTLEEENFYSVKEFLVSFNNDEERQNAVDRFNKIVNSLKEIRHPNIPKLISGSVEKRYFYLFFEYVLGGTIEQFLVEHTFRENLVLPEELVVNWAVQLCEMLNYLHKLYEPMLCVNLRPFNLVLNETNEKIVFVDIGIFYILMSLRVEEEMTPGYIAPELIESGRLDHRSDIYSLGATIHHLLTNRNPYDYPIHSFPLLRELRPELTPAIERIVAKALEGDPEQRYQSAEEMLRDLQQNCRSMPLVSFASTISYRSEISESTDEWPTFLGNPPRTSCVGKAPILPIKPRWKYQPFDDKLNYLVAANRLLYLGGIKNKLYVLDGQSGDVVGDFNLPAKLNSPPLVMRQFSYLPLDNNVVYAIDISEEKIIWKYRTEAPLLANPVMNRERIMLIPFDGSLHVIRRENGNIDWGTDLGFRVIASPAISENIAYINSLSNNILAIDVRTGNIKWRYNAKNALSASPAASSGNVFLGDHGGILYAINSVNGKVSWEKNIGGNITLPPIATSEIVYVFSSHKYLYALNVQDGSEVWKCPYNSLDVNPALAYNVIYVIRDGTDLVVLDAFTGEQKAVIPFKSKIMSTPVIANGFIYLLTGEGVFAVG